MQTLHNLLVTTASTLGKSSGLGHVSVVGEGSDCPRLTVTIPSCPVLHFKARAKLVARLDSSLPGAKRAWTCALCWPSLGWSWVF